MTGYKPFYHIIINEHQMSGFALSLSPLPAAYSRATRLAQPLYPPG